MLRRFCTIPFDFSLRPLSLSLSLSLNILAGSTCGPHLGRRTSERAQARLAQVTTLLFHAHPHSEREWGPVLFCPSRSQPIAETEGGGGLVVAMCGASPSCFRISSWYSDPGEIPFAIAEKSSSSCW